MKDYKSLNELVNEILQVLLQWRHVEKLKNHSDTFLGVYQWKQQLWQWKLPQGIGNIYSIIAFFVELTVNLFIKVIRFQ